MIKEFRIQNYKSIKDSGSIKINRITVLIGANNSGKSSLFQVLLALKQSIESFDRPATFISNGNLLQLGRYRDFIYNHNIKNSLGFEFIIDKKDVIHTFRHLKDIENDLIVNFKFGYSQKSKAVDIKRFRVRIVPDKTILDIAIKRDKYGFCIENDSFGAPKSGVNISWQGFFPIYIRFDDKISVPKSFDKNANIIEFGYSIGWLFNRFMETLYYIKPIRSEPARFYLATATHTKSVGPRGEQLADFLHLRSRNIDKFNLLRKWINDLELGKDFGISSTKDAVFSLELTNLLSNIRANLYDCGFGTSQVLPIIAQGVFSLPNSLMILEQPEIHLNPRICTKLADFFIESSKNDHRYIIETHCESILSRFRRRIAEGTLDKNDISIYYFEQTENGTKIKEIKIDENGLYINWPKDFFDEAYNELILHHKALKQNET